MFASLHLNPSCSLRTRHSTRPARPAAHHPDAALHAGGDGADRQDSGHYGGATGEHAKSAFLMQFLTHAQAFNLAKKPYLPITFTVHQDVLNAVHENMRCLYTFPAFPTSPFINRLRNAEILSKHAPFHSENENNRHHSVIHA